MTRNTPMPETRRQWGWIDDAECRNESFEIFYGLDGERGPEKERREARARKICMRCPVRRECGEHALGLPEKYGFWAAMTEDERAAERRRRMRRAAAA